MFEQIRALLASNDLATLIGSTAIAVFVTVYLWRKLSPASWRWIEQHIPFIKRIENEAIGLIVWKSAQALPGTAFGALYTALASGGDVKKSLVGALAGPIAALGHELLKAYKGQPSKSGKLPPLVGSALIGSALGLATALALLGCSLFGAKGPVWPALLDCAPSTEELFSKVESILTASSGNYEADLLALGKELGKDGLLAVGCTVREVVSKLTARAMITPDEAVGVQRGKAFLAKVEESHK